MRRSPAIIRRMSYYVVTLTRHEVIAGELHRIAELPLLSVRRGMQIQEREKRLPKQECAMEIFCLVAFIDEEIFDKFSERFGTEEEVSEILFLNQCAVSACR